MTFNLSTLALALLIFAPSNQAAKKVVLVKKTSEQLLIAKTWKLDVLRVQQSNKVFVYYTRGGRSNSENYGGDSLKFNADHTGIYYSLGSETPTTWKFTNASKTRMKLVINYPLPLIINVENIVITNKSFSFGQYYDYMGINYVGYGRRIPNE